MQKYAYYQKERRKKFGPDPHRLGIFLRGNNPPRPAGTPPQEGIFRNG